MATKQGYGADLAKYLDKRLDITLNSNRKVAGIMKGYDQFMNIVLDHAIEILKDDETRQIGTVVIRGNSIILWQSIDKIE
mmetsp:Transcript_518/g.517  ORF Transcript_518/g.517 Transcript_518/m.517 type:complete len:80 (+) Transcript_518:16-255(+)|eukprot:CAMPEP_0196994952 /NCGR_PEP_ID=MMETSP1380-20130617/1169_1 /TAXON_ID=5936 /ORGANISM="Euplotes crassus, Strain CT5" /LENGTH=79 /DNA_ID=CAMNT_0042410469 /DNA_START=16 /DNA_END=255 /DNA_ORIENTATION=-